jgi:hypothetical protein
MLVSLSVPWKELPVPSKQSTRRLLDVDGAEEGSILGRSTVQVNKEEEEEQVLDGRIELGKG